MLGDLRRINAAKRCKRLRKQQQLCVVIDGRTSRAQLSFRQLSCFSGIKRLFPKTTETDFKAATQEDVRSRMGLFLFVKVVALRRLFYYHSRSCGDPSSVQIINVKLK